MGRQRYGTQTKTDEEVLELFLAGHTLASTAAINRQLGTHHPTPERVIREELIRLRTIVVDGVDEANQVLEAAVQTAEAALDTLQAEFNTLSEEHRAVVARVETLESELADREADLANCQDELANAMAEVEARTHSDSLSRSASRSRVREANVHVSWGAPALWSTTTTEQGAPWARVSRRCSTCAETAPSTAISHRNTMRSSNIRAERARRRSAWRRHRWILTALREDPIACARILWRAVRADPKTAQHRGWRFLRTGRPWWAPLRRRKRE